MRARRHVAALVGGILPVTLLLVGTSASAVAPTADRPGLSGSTAFEGHTVTWATGGVSPVPANRPDLAASYDGVVEGGATVTFGGTMDYVIGAGFVTNLSQDASLSGGSTPQSKSYSGRVGGTTVSTPFSFSVRAPWTKDMQAQENGVAATMVASVSARNCNDWGMCGGPSVTLTFAVMKSGGRPTANKPPTIRVLPHSSIVAIGKRIPVSWAVKDDSGRAQWFAALFSGGDNAGNAQSRGLVRADGQVDRAQWPRSGGGTGPFYYCFYAKDSAGELSADAPMSSCQWVTVQVPIPAVSNGCGAATWGPQVADLMNWVGDMRTYGSTPVNIRPACNQHDAGYAGVAVAGMNTPKVTDYRTWTREEVDQKFYNDIMIQCRRFLKGPANAAYLKQCREDAYIYVDLVRKFGQGAFDADVTVGGTQPVVPAATVPPGGARDNR